MFVIGTLFESKSITCVRYAKVLITNGNNQQYLEQCFILSFTKTIQFYNKDFKKLSQITVDETLVQFELLEPPNSQPNRPPQIALITFDHKVFICDLKLVSLEDDNSMSFDENEIFSVKLKVFHSYDFKDEVQMNQNFNTTIVNYYNYLLMDTQKYIIVIHNENVLQFPKQKDWTVSYLPFNIISAYTTGGPEIVSGQSETRIKLIDCAKYDYVVLIFSNSMLSSQAILYGLTTDDGFKKVPIKQLNIGVSIESIYLINKDKPLYLCRSYLEECLKIFDLNHNTIIKKINLSFDIINIFHFDTGQGGIISNLKENIKFTYDSEFNFDFVTLNYAITLSGFAGSEERMILASQLDESLAIKDNELVHRFENIGPIAHLQEVRLNQRNIFITSLRSNKSLHRYRKGVNVKRILSTISINHQKQKPKKVFFIDDSLLLMSFNECSKVFILEGQGLVPINQHNLITNEQTVLLVQFSDDDILQVTKSAILIVTANQYDIKERIATGVSIIFADYCIRNQSLLLIDHQQFVYTINFQNQPHYIDTHTIQIPECISCISLCQDTNIVAISTLFQNNILYIIDNKGGLHKQYIEQQGKAVITSLLFQERDLNIAYTNGLIQQFSIDVELCEIRFKNSIKVCGNSPITLIKYFNKFLCLSQQIQLVDQIKLIDINLDNVESVNTSNKFIVVRLKDGFIQVIELESQESQQCTSIQHLGEDVLFLNHTKQHYFNITNTHILVYDTTNHRHLQSFKHEIKVFESKVHNNTLFLCGQNLSSDYKKQGCMISLTIINESTFQIEKKYTKNIAQSFIFHEKNVWVLQLSYLKCYSSFLNRSKSLFSHDFQMSVTGFDVISDFLLVYDESKGVGLFKYDLGNKKLVAWQQHQKPVLCAHFLGDFEAPNIICFQKNGVILVAAVNEIALGMSDKLQILFQHTQNHEPIYTTIVNKMRNQLLFGSLFGRLGFVLYIDNSVDFHSLIEFQRIMSEEDGNVSLNKQNQCHDFIDYNIIKKIKNLSESQFRSLTQKMVKPIKAQTISNIIEKVESLII